MPTHRLTAAAIVVALLGACSSDDPTGLDESVTVVAMSPPAGASNVDVGTILSLTFSHPMGDGMESFMALHERDLNGPEVLGAWTWSPDRMRLEFHPDGPLSDQSRYTFHMGGAVQDAQGRHLDYEQCINMHNAEWAWSQMMGGHQPGSGWKHQNGSYGVFFSFETG